MLGLPARLSIGLNETWRAIARAAIVATWLLIPLVAAAQSCTVGSANGNYGVVDVLSGAAVNTSTTFSVSCTGTPNARVVACVELSGGQTHGGKRRLANGGYRLYHELYADAADTIVWVGYDVEFDKHYQLRSLTLTIARADNKNIIWQGTAAGPIHTDAASKSLEEVVTRMLSSFPPK